MTSRSSAVTAFDLMKVFPHPQGGELRALDGVSFEVDRGEIFGLLGPNGAGKTTVLEIVEGIQKPTAGSAEVMGFDTAAQLQAIKPLIGVQLQTSAYPERLRLQELLELLAGFYGKSVDAEGLLEAVGLTDRRNSLISKLSEGQARRFSVIAALAHDPELIFLDEPTSGLDPQVRRTIWDLVTDLRGRGTTIV
ncbi:MAG: ABC transporter ATP-binding protein, partial [Actinomycetota bacterium]